MSESSAAGQIPEYPGQYPGQPPGQPPGQKFARAAATVGAWTAVSRILGFVRDVVIAAGLGAGPIADAFFIAFRLPNFFRQLFGEGAFNAAFVPIFSQKLAKDSENSANAPLKNPDSAHFFANQALAMMGLVLVILVVIGEIWTGGLVSLMAHGFQDSERFDLAVSLTRITFPYMLFICLAALYSGVLNSMGKFAAAAATPVLLNITTILAALFPQTFPLLNGVLAQYFGGLWRIENYLPNIAYSLSWGVLVAGIWQLAWLHRNAAKYCMKLRPMAFYQRPINGGARQISPAIKKLWQRMGPGVFGAGIVQINLLIGTQIATFLPVGAVSYLYYADRLNQLPMAIIATAMGTALLPLLSRQLAKGEHEAALHTQNRALEVTLALTLPAMVGLIILAHPIISVLFERGEFTENATNATAKALIGFAIGLPAYCLIKLFTPAFFARNDTKTPVRVAMGSIGLNIALNFAFIAMGFGHVSIALATALSSWLNLVLLVTILRRRGYYHMDGLAFKRVPLLILAALVQMGLLGLAWLGWRDFGESELAVFYHHPFGLTLKIIELGFFIALGCGVFFAVALAIGAINSSQFLRAISLIRRKFSRKDSVSGQ